MGGSARAVPNGRGGVARCFSSLPPRSRRKDGVQREKRGRRRLLDSLLGHASANYFTMLPRTLLPPPQTSVSFLRVPFSLRSLSFPDFLLGELRALMLLVFSLVRTALSSPPPRIPACRRMLLEGIRRSAHGSSPVVAPH
jgi:hypothetical protein